MGYKIEEVGFEYRDHKLGQMTDIGRIIGFNTDTSSINFIAVETQDSQLYVSQSVVISVVLNNYENSRIRWYNPDQVIIIDSEQKECEVDLTFVPLNSKDKIIVQHDIWDDTLIIRCVKCDDFKAISTDNFSIIKSNAMVFALDCLCLKVGDTHSKRFENEHKAKEYLDKVLKLINMVNDIFSGIDNLDLNSNNDLNNNNVSITIMDHKIKIVENFVYLIKDNDTFITSEWNKNYLSDKFIKEQLKATIKHLYEEKEEL